jgi:hypothetical protein
MRNSSFGSEVIVLGRSAVLAQNLGKRIRAAEAANVFMLTEWGNLACDQLAAALIEATSPRVEHLAWEACIITRVLQARIGR